MTYVEARHFNKRRSKTKKISLGSPIEEVRHGSEMFALIAGDGSFNVFKANGRIVRNVRTSSRSERVIGASISQAAYVFLREDVYFFLEAGIFQVASWRSRAKRLLVLI